MTVSVNVLVSVKPLHAVRTTASGQADVVPTTSSAALLKSIIVGV